MTKKFVNMFCAGARLMLCFAMLFFGVAVSAQTFSHFVGKQGATFDSRGMQVVHEYRQVVYAKPGSKVTLYRPDCASFRRYARWYDYSTDAAASNLTVTSGAVSTAAGAFLFENPNDKSATYTVPADGNVHYIACDQSAYADYQKSSTAIVEPTLSQRLVFEIRPAAEMAALVDAATGDNWLETYDLIAPVGNTLYIGPKYGFVEGANYRSYYYNASNPTILDYKLFKTGVVTTNGTSNWKTTAQPDKVTTYVCIEDYSDPTVITATLSVPSTGWADGVRGDNKSNSWMIQQVAQEERTFSLSLPSYRTISSVTLSLRNRVSSQSSYVVNINGAEVKSGTLGVSGSNVSVSIGDISYTGGVFSLNVSNTDIDIKTISIKYGNSYSVGDVVSAQPAAAYRFYWEKRVYQSGDFTDVRTYTNKKVYANGWRWSMDGVEDDQPSLTTGQFFSVSCGSAGTHEYCLTYNTEKRVVITTTDTIRVRTGELISTTQWNGEKWASETIEDNRIRTSYDANTPSVSETFEAGKDVNLAKFTVKYLSKNEVGPSLDLEEGSRIKSSTLLTERRFNETGNTFSSSNTTYLLSPIEASECSYGFYWGTSNRATTSNYARAGKDEYALINNAKELSWYMGSTGIVTTGSCLTNHYFTNESEDLPGYMLFVDGSERPGDLLSMTTKAKLCPGSKMYFSAYIADLSTKGSTAPNLDFILIGIDAMKNEHVLTTYTTGEFGYNGKDKTSSGKWMRILFPFEFGDDVDYVSYKLKITNKGKNGNGNDFAIDDIQIYVQNPPVMPIQASTVACPVNGVSSTYAYLRVDYGAISATAPKFYYQWRNHDDNVIDTLAYLNSGVGAKYGQIVIADDPTTTGLVYPDIASFDEEVQSPVTPTPNYGYVRETCSDGNERYVLYIAQPMNLLVNHKYYGYVAADAKDLGPGNSCSASAELMVAAGVTFKMGENVISNGETQTVCAAEPGTLQMLYRYIRRDTQGGMLSLVELTNVKADWLFGDEDYINDNTDMYCGADYATIMSAISHYRSGDADANQTRLFNMLVKSGLLIPNVSNITPNMMGIGSGDVVAYTACPIVSSIEELVQETVLCADPSTFYFRLGDEGANSITIASSQDVVTDASWNTLPLYVKINPRRIRVSENKVVAGNAISMNIHLVGAERAYNCSQAVLVTTDNPEAAYLVSSKRIDVEFLGNSDPHVINNNTTGMTIVAGETGLKGLAAGYDYTFQLERVRTAGDVEDCSDFNTFFTFRIVPAVVTWEGTDGSAWNNDYNWDTYAPLPDTKVVLRGEDYIVPANVALSDNLQRDANYEDGAAAYITYDINYASSECGDIYVPAGATLVNQHRLTINGKAYFDLPLVGGKWTLTAFPIQGVVSGDIFIPATEYDGASEPFSVASIHQTVGQPATDRTANKMYASLYNQRATLVGSGQKELTSADFTGAINDVTQKFALGMGTSIKADFTGQKVIRLPKDEDTYYYYDQTGAWVDWAEPITRDANYGKPAYLPTGADGVNGMDITLTNNSVGKWFLFGNPTFANINIVKFIDRNSAVLAGPCTLMTLEAGTRNSIIQATYHPGIGYVTANGDRTLTSLPVGCAMLFKTRSDAQTVTLRVTPDMLQPNSVPEDGAHHVQSMNKGKEIAISLRHNSVTNPTCYISRALLREDESAADYFVEGEDAEAMLLEAAKTRFVIYTTSDNKACAINQISAAATTVPLAVYSTYTGTISKEFLCFEGDNDYLNEWDLVKLSDNTRTQLYDSLTLKVVMPLDGTIDYVLEHTRKSPAVATDFDEATQEQSKLSVYTADNYLFAYSNEDMMDFSIYDASGRLVAAEKNAGQTAQFHLPSGVYMVRANGEVIKTIVK